MPLTCDCYPGCWGDHSEDWGHILNVNRIAYKLAVEILPYGTYVAVEREEEELLAIEEDELIAKLLAHAGLKYIKGESAR